MAPPFRVVALLSAFNEEDVIARVIEHLIQNGLEVYLLDNHSTDATAREASQWIGKGLLGIETFPPDSGPSTGFPWADILRRKEALATEIQSDWFIHHDADEIRESPWPGFNLRQAIQWVDSLGYSAIDFRVFNFPPVDDGFRKGDDLRTYFTRYEPGAEYDRVQIKCWKSNPTASISQSGGHEVVFDGRRVFPIPFLLRHYPVRSQKHGLTKVFTERQPRFLENERRLGWHRQYDAMAGEHRFIRDPESLMPFSLDQARLEVLRPDADLERELHQLRSHVAEVDRDRDSLRGEVAVLIAEAERVHRHVTSIEADRDELRRQIAELGPELDQAHRHAAAVSADRDDLRRHMSMLGQELDQAHRHATAVSADRDDLRQHLGTLGQEIERAHRHAAAVELDRDNLRRHIATLGQELEQAHRHAGAVETDRGVLRQELATLRKDLEQSQQGNHALVVDHDRLRERADDLAAELAAVHASRTWRVRSFFRGVRARLTGRDSGSPKRRV